MNAAGQVVQRNSGHCRNLPLIILLSDRPLLLQQRAYNSFEQHDVPNYSYLPMQPALRDPLRTSAHLDWSLLSGFWTDYSSSAKQDGQAPWNSGFIWSSTAVLLASPTLRHQVHRDSVPRFLNFSAEAQV